jgi:hypothetical protein
MSDCRCDPYCDPGLTLWSDITRYGENYGYLEVLEMTGIAVENW